MPTVFIVNHAGHDYTKAERWGNLSCMTTGHVAQGSLDRLIYDVAIGLQRSEPEDWLLPAGLLILNVIAAAIWMRKHNELRVLVRDRKLNDYRELKITSDHFNYLIRTAVSDGQRGSDSNDSEDPNRGL